MDLQILDDALIHRLCLACGIRRQEKQGDGFWVFNLAVGGAVVDDDGDFSFLSLEATVKLLQPYGEEVRRGPCFFVGFVCCWHDFDALKHRDFFDYPITRSGSFSVPDMLAHTITVTRSLI